MQVLTIIFFLLSITGVWKPRGWRGMKAVFFYIYCSIVIIVNYIFLITGSLDLEFKNIDLEAFIDNFSLILSTFIAQKKINCVIENRKKLIHITDSFKNSSFKLRDRQEELIFSRFEKLARNIFIYYFLIFFGALLIYSSDHLSVMDPPYTLPYNGWFPYNYTRSKKIYWATCVQQIYAVYNSATIDLILDLLLPCIMCYMCGYIHILKHRFGVMTEKLQIMSENNESQEEIVYAERKMMAEWVEYHIDILRLVRFANGIFSRVIFMQYTSSSLLLCTIAYLLSHTDPASMSFAGNLGFFFAMVIQILLPCYCADKLTFEFLDISTGIYDTNWHYLSNNIRRSVVVIIQKTHRPVMITSGYFVILSLESFIKVIKLAYTIYNVLE
ncbi:odorant receptor 2a-like [Microplitis mediator]|uniref:odorant receptor 2a-like n=1 Tax=Microplitis mediator TaxID=375433 RepID=UPI0025559543|nr:odorant receptor 2a-like [Microplitis mediator]XP_057318477.1 odorant receptor 2a-like [Microplitis mediator]WNA12538.1 olfactory receptor [Microplitis mediator]